MPTPRPRKVGASKEPLLRQLLWAFRKIGRLEGYLLAQQERADDETVEAKKDDDEAHGETSDRRAVIGFTTKESRCRTS